MRPRPSSAKINKVSVAALMLSIVFGICGQLLMKRAALDLDLSAAPLYGLLSVALAVIVYSAGIACWIVALASLPLSVAYPVTSLSYVGIMWGSAIWFDEHLSMLRLTGVALIFAGVALVVLRQHTETSVYSPSAGARRS